MLKSADISRVHRERLLRNGFLEKVIKGWLAVNSRPGTRRRVDDAWSTVYWEFAESYLNARFGSEWSLSAEGSVSFLSGQRAVPAQLIVRSPHAGNEVLKLPGGSSIFFLRGPMPESTGQVDGMRVMGAEDALCNLAPNSWRTMETDVVSVLGSIRGSSSLLRYLLSEGRSTIAGRIVGALRMMGRNKDADDIMSAMQSAGYSVREENPFDESAVFQPTSIRPGGHPAATRIRLLWAKMRNDALSAFDLERRTISDKAAYMKSIDERYVSDAYNSLSIEGYHVSEELIERVRSGSWNPDKNVDDWDRRNALAARGYWLAFNAVREDVFKIISGTAPGPLLWDRHQEWFRQMFAPSVTAGILKPHELAGYRGHPIYLRGSNHVPTPHGAIPDALEALFDCVSEESDPRVNALLTPFLFTYIHPFHDGNGRIGRFLMNALLAEGGFPWTIIPYDRRAEYLASLESASQQEDIRPLARMISELVSSPPPPRPSETAYLSWQKR
ncbi:Fic family protein [Mesorhizobium sp. B2-3-5]|uniref:Fic family protein n=1 Tax=Mesorhizobium sp. B2-3-5 TaxID=2589958 RepID=UPI001FEDBB04|nr:Fic family protein [Mesorhizobium sp. B2-3-5]